jgi:hypothetical protein
MPEGRIRLRKARSVCRLPCQMPEAKGAQKNSDNHGPYGRAVVFVGVLACRHLPRQGDLAVTSLNNAVA